MASASPLPLRIAEEIRELIRSGRLPVGAHLGTQQLADRFGVSRSPVREAPTSLILSAAMMLGWLGEQRQVAALEAAGQAIDAAVDRVLADPASRTRDLGGSLGTREFGQRVAQALAAGGAP